MTGDLADISGEVRDSCLREEVMKLLRTRLWLLISLVGVIAGLTAAAVRADVFTDLGLLPGGSLAPLPAAQVVDPLPQGSAKEPLFDSAAFSCPNGAASTTGSTFGYVVLNTHGPKNAAGEQPVVTAEVVVQNGIPNATYQIYLNQYEGGCPTMSTGTLTTNGQGNGTGHDEQPRVPGAKRFWVSAFDETAFAAGKAKSILRSPAATLN
jgi:hypothetical protein